MIHDKYYYIIKQFYEGKYAKRSKQPYIKHINEGITILQKMNADIPTIQAFCLHPIFQDDNSLKSLSNDFINDINHFLWLCRKKDEVVQSIYEVVKGGE